MIFAAPKPSEVKKTGLGSSAALVTSLTAALLNFLEITHIPLQSNSTNPNKSHPDYILLHNLAQISHCLAQVRPNRSYFHACKFDA